MGIMLELLKYEDAMDLFHFENENRLFFEKMVRAEAMAIIRGRYFSRGIAKYWLNRRVAFAVFIWLKILAEILPDGSTWSILMRRRAQRKSASGWARSSEEKESEAAH